MREDQLSMFMACKLPVGMWLALTKAVDQLRI